MRREEPKRNSHESFSFFVSELSSKSKNKTKIEITRIAEAERMYLDGNTVNKSVLLKKYALIARKKSVSVFSINFLLFETIISVMLIKYIGTFTRVYNQ
jgi:hypothetical protein